VGALVVKNSGFRIGFDMASSMVACDFFTVETVWLKRIYVLVFIELATRRMHLAGCTTNPDGMWMAPQARNFTFLLDGREKPLRVSNS
jgi:putative transposase